MRKILFFISLCVLVVFDLNAQSIKVFYENEGRSTVLYADNYELYPVSLSFQLDLLNLTFSEADKEVFVIPPQKENLK